MAEGERRRLRKGPLGLLAGGVLLLGAGGALVLTGGLPGCDEQTARGVETVKLGNKTFHLELANTGPTRMRGLSERDFIEQDGGMLFVFPDNQVRVQSFVMRDCPIDIDIIYLDSGGRILAMHEMKAEAPRGPSEGVPGSTDNMAYEQRLKRYPSKFPAQFAIELRGGTIKTLDIKEGDQLSLNVKRLKADAQ
jgi:hypothetical protein